MTKQPGWLRRISLLVFAVIVAGCTSTATGQKPEVRNYILMIGDGMGFNQVRLAEEYADRKLVMTSLPVKGDITTRSANNAVTDSAAAGTALACGIKTNNGMLGMLPDETIVPSVAEKARDAGKRVGILTSVTANHATPAAYYGKVTHRNMYYQIGLQALETRFEVIGGTGWSDEKGRNHKPPAEKGLNTLTLESGRKIIRTPAELEAATAADGPYLITPAKFYTHGGVSYANAADPEQHISLAQMTAKTLELLDNPDGFFLMVEGGAIDWACHANNAVGSIAETLAFDEAIAVARAYVEKNPDTLLVITADHETGGLTIGDDYDAAKARAVFAAQKVGHGKVGDWLKDHTKGLGEDKEGQWAEVCKHLSDILGVEETAFSEKSKDYYEKMVKAEDSAAANRARGSLVRNVFHDRDAVVGVSWTTGGHTGANVPVFAFGAGAERFEGTQDNTQIPTLGAELMGAPLK